MAKPPGPTPSGGSFDIAYATITRSTPGTTIADKTVTLLTLGTVTDPTSIITVSTGDTVHVTESGLYVVFLSVTPTTTLSAGGQFTATITWHTPILDKFMVQFVPSLVGTGIGVTCTLTAYFTTATDLQFTAYNHDGTDARTFLHHQTIQRILTG